MTIPLSPKELAKQLSYGKAFAVAEKHTNAIVIGADTFVALHNTVLGKPHTKERAEEMLHLLSGKLSSSTFFGVVSSALVDVVRMVNSPIGQKRPLGNKPDEIGISFGVKLSTVVGVVIASASAEANFGATMY